jgi:hypothetical protein
MVADPDLESLHDLPGFAAILQRLREARPDP